MVELLKLEIEGFGKFANKKVINFERGINFINGLNESGKSTILEAILASLFKYANPKIEPYLCWTNKDVCRLALTYKTDNNETFKIISDYKNGRKILEKITNGHTAEISSTISTIHKYIKEHFGFDEQKVFENTTFIRQSQMAILGDSTTKNKIRDMIEEVFVGTAEASATKSLKNIKKVVKDSTKEAKRLQDDLYELKKDMQNAEEIKENMNNDSGEYERVSKDVAEKTEIFERLKETYKKFQEKEKYTSEAESLEKDINKIDKALIGINEDTKNRDALNEKKEKYVGYDSLSDISLSKIKELIKNINDAEISLKTHNSSTGKHKVIEERLDLKYVILFIVGLVLSLVLIGIPLAVYAYKRMKIKIEKEVVDTGREEEIEKLKRIISENEETLKELTKGINDFNKGSFVEQYNKYSNIVSQVNGYYSSIIGLLKTELESNEIGEDISENIKKIETKKMGLLNKLTIAQNNLTKFKLVEFSEDDLVKLQTLEKEVKKLNERKIELKTSVNKTKEFVKSPEEIREELNSIEEKINELNENAEEHELAYQFLEMAETEVQHKFTPSIEKNAKPILKEVTNNKYTDLKINEEDLSNSRLTLNSAKYLHNGIFSALI